MSDLETKPAERIQLSPETVDALRATFRAAGGVTYSSPKGEMAAITERKLFLLLAGFVARADAAGAQRAALMVFEVSPAEQALRALVGAICPGLDSGDLLADSATAIAAMATTQPLAYFGVDEEPATDGSARYLHVAGEYAGDEDVFPLYRRAATVDELKAALQAHADLHQLKTDPAGSGDASTGTANATTKAAKAAAAKAASK